MPYQSTSDLPDNVKNVLPNHAQEIFKEAFNNAYDEYKDPEDRRGDSSREDVARRVAWSAVKQKYEKGDDGKWHSKHD
ncbi:MAG TPA: putative cation transport regulator ChaB [Candidatus Saccharimonadales bacterium]|nr:putative cation transport regulator ChaB [Candidatus Saccharimonadales bacterium]